MKEHWDEFSTLMAAGEEKQAGKEEFAYKDSGEGESEMVVCVRVRPRLMPFMLCTKSCANALWRMIAIMIRTHILFFNAGLSTRSRVTHW